MIFDNIERLERYASFREKCLFALNKIKSGVFDSCPPGKYDLGDKMFVVIQEYETAEAESQPFETHRQTVEMIYIAKGAERVLVCEANKLGAETSPYEPEKDRTFFLDPPAWSSLLLSSGQYVIVVPEEGHKTRCNPETGLCSNVRKYLVKVML